jgi:hypothetical protein
MDSLTETSIEDRQAALDRMGVPPAEEHNNLDLTQAAEELSPRREDRPAVEVEYHKRDSEKAACRGGALRS